MNKDLKIAYAMIVGGSITMIAAAASMRRTHHKENEKRAKIRLERDLDLAAIAKTEAVMKARIDGGREYRSVADIIEDTNFELKFQKIAIRED